MTTRLLEVGASYNTAIANPGNILQDKNVEYFAIDAKGVSTLITYSKMSIFDADEWPHERHKRACVGTLKNLPFRPETFGHVIMKSVIGEYSINLQRGRGPNKTGMMSDQTYTDTMQGFHEALRVLEPGGKLVVSEEDSPADCLQLASHLADVGFEDITITPYNARRFTTDFGEYREHDTRPFFYEQSPRYTHADPAWLALRGAYWSVTNKVDQWGQVPLGSEANDVAESYWQHAYVMTAVKP